MKTSYVSLIAIVMLAVGSLSAEDDERMFYVKVTKGAEISGQIIGISEFKVGTSFGEITIPVGKVEAIKMDADGQGSAVIAFNNGDMVTGKMEISDLKLKTNWGKAHVNSDAITSITANQYGRFYTDPTAGGWRYSRGNPQQQGMMRGSGQRIQNNR